MLDMVDIVDKGNLVDNFDIVEQDNKFDRIYMVAIVDPLRPGWPWIYLVGTNQPLLVLIKHIRFILTKIDHKWP